MVYRFATSCKKTSPFAARVTSIINDIIRRPPYEVVGIYEHRVDHSMYSNWNCVYICNEKSFQAPTVSELDFFSSV